MSDCPHGLDDRWCGVCLNGPERSAPWRPVTRGTADHVTTSSKFDSTCKRCGDPIRVGDQISLESNGTDTRWVCCA